MRSGGKYGDRFGWAVLTPRTGLLLLVASTLAGCATISGLDTAEVRSDLDSWNARVYEEGAALHAATETRVASIEQDAATQRGDTTRPHGLGELYVAGITNNYRLMVARKSIDVADAELVNATLRFFPSLNGTLSAVQTHQNILDSDNVVFKKGKAEYPTYNALLEAKMPLFNLENLFEHRKATAGSRKAQVEYIGTAQTYVRDLIAAFLDLAEANAIIDEYKQKTRLISRRVETERLLQESAGGRPEIVASFEQQLSDAKAHLVTDEGRRKQAMARLYELTGIDVKAVSGAVNVKSLALPVEDIDSLRTLAARNNVQYLAKQYEVDMFQDELNSAQSRDFAPKINAFATAEYEDRGGSQFGGGSTSVQSTVGIEMKVPIFNGEGQGYKSLPANAEYELAVAELGLLRREIDSDLTRAFYDFSAARDRIKSDNRTIARGKDIIYLVNQRIESDNAVSTEGLQSELEQAEFVRQRQQTSFDLLRQWLTVKYLLGALSENDIAIFSGAPLPPNG